MLTYRRIPVALSVALFAILVASATASATPITVHLRVEGSTKTLFEGDVTTQAETFETESSGGAHPCDYKENGPGSAENKTFEDGGNDSGTPTTALRDAALESGLAFNAEWFGSGSEEKATPGDFLITQVGDDISNSEKNGEYWGFAVNDTTASVGGCQIALAPGNEVLWAYNYFNLTHLLSLSGPATANIGSPVTVHVVDGQTGSPLAGAAIGEDIAGVTTTLPGSALTNGEGNVTITLAHAGMVTLKATQSESVRSNGFVICIHNGNDGTCGTTIPGTPKLEAPPVHITPLDAPKIGGITNGHHYGRRNAPRILRGLVQVPAGGTLREVRISLTRRNGKRCQAFNGTSETFVHARCGAGHFFSVGSAESFSYLLPTSLPKGRYVYGIEAIEDSGSATKLVARTSHVVFYVK